MIKNAIQTIEIGPLVSQSTGAFLASPTLAAGDVKVGGDGGSLANIAALPTVLEGGALAIALTAAETNYDRLRIVFSDVAGNEWAGVTVNDTADSVAKDWASGGRLDVLLADIPNSATATANKDEIIASGGGGGTSVNVGQVLTAIVGPTSLVGRQRDLVMRVGEDRKVPVVVMENDLPKDLTGATVSARLKSRTNSGSTTVGTSVDCVSTVTGARFAAGVVVIPWSDTQTATWTSGVFEVELKIVETGLDVVYVAPPNRILVKDVVH